MGLEVRTFALFISLLIDCYFRSHKFSLLLPVIYSINSVLGRLFYFPSFSVDSIYFSFQCIYSINSSWPEFCPVICSIILSCPILKIIYFSFPVIYSIKLSCPVICSIKLSCPILDSIFSPPCIFYSFIFFGVFIRILFRSIEAAFLAGEPEIQLNSSNRSVTLNLVNR